MVSSQVSVTVCPGRVVQMHNSTRAGQWTRRDIGNQYFLQGSQSLTRISSVVHFPRGLSLNTGVSSSSPTRREKTLNLSKLIRLSALSFSSLGFALCCLWVERHKPGNLNSFLHHCHTFFLYITPGSDSVSRQL